MGGRSSKIDLTGVANGVATYPGGEFDCCCTSLIEETCSVPGTYSIITLFGLGRNCPLSLTTARCHTLLVEANLNSKDFLAFESSQPRWKSMVYNSWPNITLQAMRTFNLWVAILSESLLSLAFARGSSKLGPYKVKEEILPPFGWVKHSLPPSDHLITLRIGLPQQNLRVLEKHLDEISDPDHERYGKHLSKLEVEELVSPHPDSLEAVNTWLSTFDFRKEELDRSPANDWAILTIPISKAEELLNTVNFFFRPKCLIIHTHTHSLRLDVLYMEVSV